MPADVEVLREESELEEIGARWDALALASNRPFSAPAWMLAWWRHARPEGAAIRTVAVSEGDDLIGLAPLWVYDGDARRAHYDVLAGKLAPGGLLAAPGRQREVAALLARALARTRPKLAQLRLEEAHAGESWAATLARAWPGRAPWIEAAEPVQRPIVRLGEGGFEELLEEKSGSFRRESKRRRRGIEETGAKFVLAREADVERAVDAFLRLHAARWDGRGGSTIMVQGIRRMLLEAAGAMVPADRMRIFLLEIEGEPIAAQMMLTAPGEACCWQGGFDESWSRLSPLAQLILHAIADAAERGERRVDLGSGGQEYKLRIANASERVSVLKLTPRGLSYARRRLWLVTARARPQKLPRLLGGTGRRTRG